MANLLTLARRQASTVPIPHTMIALLVVLLVLLIMILLLIAALYFFRQRRTRAHRPDLLPVYEDAEKRLSTASTSSHHRRVMVRPSESVYVISEKGTPLDETAPSTPTSAIPEIRITFPEEFDDLGKRKSGRVVVVRVGDTSVGLEPVSVEEKSPVYDQHDESFQSLDLDRVGGLVEKARNAPSKEYQ